MLRSATSRQQQNECRKILFIFCLLAILSRAANFYIKSRKCHNDRWHTKWQKNDDDRHGEWAKKCHERIDDIFVCGESNVFFLSFWSRHLRFVVCVSVWRDTRHVDCIHQLMEIHNPNALLSFYVVIWLSFFALTSIRTRWDIVSEPMKYFHRPHNSRWHSSSKRTNECDRNYKKSTRKPQNVKYFHSRLFRW